MPYHKEKSSYLFYASWKADVSLSLLHMVLTHLCRKDEAGEHQVALKAMVQPFYEKFGTSFPSGVFLPFTDHVRVGFHNLPEPLGAGEGDHPSFYKKGQDSFMEEKYRQLMEKLAVLRDIGKNVMDYHAKHDVLAPAASSSLRKISVFDQGLMQRMQHFYEHAEVHNEPLWQDEAWLAYIHVGEKQGFLGSPGYLSKERPETNGWVEHTLLSTTHSPHGAFRFPRKEMVDSIISHCEKNGVSFQNVVIVQASLAYSNVLGGVEKESPYASVFSDLERHRLDGKVDEGLGGRGQPSSRKI